jgi:hypothetical protein
MGRHPLDELIAREACAEILSLLRPDELVVAALRLEGLDDAQIGRRLGMDGLTVSQRMIRAQQRIAAQRPDLAGLLAGRRMRPSLRQPDVGPKPSTPGGEHAEMETDTGRRRQTDRP